MLAWLLPSARCASNKWESHARCAVSAVIHGILLLLSLGCDQSSTSGNSSVPEVSRQKVSKQEVVRFVEEINKRAAIKPPLDSQVETHFQLIRQILPDDLLLSVFETPRTIRRRVLLEYQDTVAANGMFQTNCSYDFGDCELVIHLTLLPDGDSNLVDHMRQSWTKNDVGRREQSGEKLLWISKGDRHLGGTVFGEKLLVSFFARKQGGAVGNDFGISEDRIWAVLQSLASRVE